MPGQNPSETTFNFQMQFSASWVLPPVCKLIQETASNGTLHLQEACLSNSSESEREVMRKALSQTIHRAF